MVVDAVYVVVSDSRLSIDRYVLPSGGDVKAERT